MDAITVTVKKVGKVDVLCIEIPMTAPVESQSGKTLVVASTHGNQATTAQANGKPVYLGVNAYIRK